MNERKMIYLDDAIEAIEEITWYHQNCNNEMVKGANSSEHQAWYKAEDVYEAFEKLPSAQPDVPDTNVGDMISRQAAINEFDGVKVNEENCTEYDIGYNDGIDFAISKLSVLPSAQPEPIKNTSEPDAIFEKRIRGMFDSIWDCEIDHPIFQDTVGDLMRAVIECYKTTLSSAQPERKKGHWIKPTGMMPPEYAGVYRCSECGNFAMRDWKTHKQTLTDCCPYCFADMREGEADEG